MSGHAQAERGRSIAGAIIAGIDGSGSDTEVVRWAVDLARAERRPLVLAHVVDLMIAEQPIGPMYEGYSRAKLVDELTRIGDDLVRRARQLARTRAPALEIRELVETGDPAQVLLELTGHGAAAIVVGSTGRGRVMSALLGSVSATIARAAACPAYVIRAQHAVGISRGVLVACDSRPGATPVIEAGFRAAAERALPLTVLHTVGNPAGETRDGYAATFDHEVLQQARLATSEAIAGLREKYPDVQLTVDFVLGTPWQAILGGAAGMELIVVGRHERSLVERLRHGASTTNAILEHAICPVLVVPDPAARTRD